MKRLLALLALGLVGCAASEVMRGDDTTAPPADTGADHGGLRPDAADTLPEPNDTPVVPPDAEDDQPVAGCGDHACKGDESCATCPADCGACAAGCGNAACTGFETCATCPMDCGPCVADGDDPAMPDTDLPRDTDADPHLDGGDTAAECGDHACTGKEGCVSCPEDCGPCSECGDNACGPDENCTVCPADCDDCEVSTGCWSSDLPGCGGCTCEACVCADDPYCCIVKWDNSCVDECEEACGGCYVLETCGNGWCDGVETCTLCPEDCGPCNNPGCRIHEGSGCAGCLCEDAVCASDVVCCVGDWDKYCVQACADAGFCASDGCHATPIPGCNGCPCQSTVCADDPLCCDDAWDGWCVDACIDVGACD